MKTGTEAHGKADAFHHGLRRNRGIAFDAEWVQGTTADAVRIDRIARELRKRPRLEGDARAESLLRALSCIDLTSLSGDDTPNAIRRLCAIASGPLDPDTVRRLGLSRAPRVAAVCVYPAYVETANEALHGADIPVATVAAGFPHGLSPIDIRIAEVRRCAELGAAEIDVVIRRSHVLLADWVELYEEIRRFRDAAGNALLKVILATGELGPLNNVIRAGLVALMAGADFIKTSTGKEAENATLPAGIAMAGSIRAYFERTGFRAGLKPAGGIRTAEAALDWLALVESELGADWLEPARLRLGASGLVDAIGTELCSPAGARDDDAPGAGNPS